MPATIPAIAQEIVVRCAMEDVFGEDVNKTFVLDGALSDAEVATILDDFEAITNARFKRVTLSRVQTVTGMRNAAVNALERNVGNQMILGFTKPDPVREDKTVNRTFIIPAHVAAIEALDGSPIYTPAATPSSGPEYLARLLTNLETGLQYQGVDGNYYPGFNFTGAGSGAATVPNVIDGV